MRHEEQQNYAQGAWEKYWPWAHCANPIWRDICVGRVVLQRVGKVLTFGHALQTPYGDICVHRSGTKTIAGIVHEIGFTLGRCVIPCSHLRDLCGSTPRDLCVPYKKSCQAFGRGERREVCLRTLAIEELCKPHWLRLYRNEDVVDASSCANPAPRESWRSSRHEQNRSRIVLAAEKPRWLRG